MKTGYYTLQITQKQVNKSLENGEKKLGLKRLNENCL